MKEGECMDIPTILALFKTDLAIKHTVRDEYFTKVIEGAVKEIEEKGITLEPDNVADTMLVVDYSVWSYRHRMENIPFPPNIKLRIRNRIVNERGKR